MFNQEKIDEIHQKAIEKKWPFSYIFNSFKAMGVDRIETNVLTCEIKYVGGGTSLIEPPPDDFTPLVAASAFNVELVKAACAKREAYEVDYIQFLTELAAAGVSFFRVDMRPRTVTYHGPTPKNKYVEIVPQS